MASLFQEGFCPWAARGSPAFFFPTMEFFSSLRRAGARKGSPLVNLFGSRTSLGKPRGFSRLTLLPLPDRPVVRAPLIGINGLSSLSDLCFAGCRSYGNEEKRRTFPLYFLIVFPFFRTAVMTCSFSKSLFPSTVFQMTLGTRVFFFPLTEIKGEA